MIRATFAFFLFVCLISSESAFAISERFRQEEDVRVALGVGGIYEGLILDGAIFNGGGPEIEINIEFRLAKYSAFGFGTRYRNLSALGPGADSTSTALIKISNFDYFIYGKFEWLHVLAGVEQFNGTLIQAGATSSEENSKGYFPLFGAGTTLFVSGRYKGRIHLLYAYGEAFGSPISSVQGNLGLTVTLP